VPESGDHSIYNNVLTYNEKKKVLLFIFSIRKKINLFILVIFTRRKKDSIFFIIDLLQGEKNCFEPFK